MTDPLAPQIPADAPQDVKDFFDCKGDKLVWKKGPVTWLGIGINPDVEFAPAAGKNKIDIKVTIGTEPFALTFSLPASVNANGELVVDTSKVPDLSMFGIDGKGSIDAAIKRINDWFKKNGKKLKQPVLKDGEVTLEKTPIAPPPAGGVPVVPATPKPATPPPPPAPAPTTAPNQNSGGWCSLLGGILAFMFFGVIAFGGAIGFAFLGGPPQTPFNPGRTSLPTTAVTATTAATATPAPSQSATGASTQSPSQIATQTPQPTATSVPSVSATPVTLTIAEVCIRVVHQPIEQFLSYLDWFIYVTGGEADYFELTVEGGNNDEPQQLIYDPEIEAWVGRVGLLGIGDKKIVSVVAHMTDGSSVDVTQALTTKIGGDELTVRFPREDVFGNCPTT